MKKIYRLHDLDCANCAAKMERAIQKIDGVTYAEVNFMSQRLILEAEESALPVIVEKAKACIAKVEPGCKIMGA